MGHLATDTFFPKMEVRVQPRRMELCITVGSGDVLRCPSPFPERTEEKQVVETH